MQQILSNHGNPFSLAAAVLDLQEAVEAHDAGAPDAGGTNYIARIEEMLTVFDEGRGHYDQIPSIFDAGEVQDAP